MNHELVIKKNKEKLKKSKKVLRSFWKKGKHKARIWSQMIEKSISGKKSEAIWV